MSLVTRTIPGLSNGISLQPPILRSPDQTEDEVNTWGVVAVGLGRRPPTAHVADLDVAGVEEAFLHHINRDRAERYVVVIKDGTLRVFNEDTGVEQAVTAPFGLGYLAGTSKDTVRAVTVNDYTFIINTAKKVALDDVGVDEATPPAYVSPGGYLAWGSAIV